MTTNCGECFACIGSDLTGAGPDWVTVGMTRMILCATCGNKRCPHATDHRHDCTGSNEGNQPGSRYQYPTNLPDPITCTGCTREVTVGELCVHSGATCALCCGKYCGGAE